MDIKNQVILLIGKTGAGKSSLGNMLIGRPHDDGPFYASADMDSVTKECHSAKVSINGVMYDIVDTPGIFDTRQSANVILQEISKSVNKCAFGVKAILVTFEAKRFTEEQKNVLNGIRTFLGKDATNYLVSVFSHATKGQIENRNTMKAAWNGHVSSFIQNIGNRWGISPDPNYFSPNDPTYQIRLKEIKDSISSIQGFYTTEQFEKNQQEQERIRRKKQEKERIAKQEYEERLREKGRREVEEKMRREMEEQRRKTEEQVESMRREMREQQKIQERKNMQEREEREREKQEQTKRYERYQQEQQEREREREREKQEQTKRHERDQQEQRERERERKQQEREEQEKQEQEKRLGLLGEPL